MSDWKQRRLRTIYETAEMVVKGGVEGDFAEFGIYTGNSFKVLGVAMSEWDEYTERFGYKRRTLHGFDTFDGLPESNLPQDTDSPLVKSNIWSAGSMKGTTPDALCERLKDYLAPDRIKLYPGLFADTLQSVPRETKFSIVHLDCDLYESTKQVLCELETNGQISDGCAILLDDFFENRGSPKFGQRAAWEEWAVMFDIKFTPLGHYGRSSWRCIYHKDQ